ncbi:hypothetical protein N7456_001958 [Penicillium angulare]|uniref:Uncharacterized protein n=1 Tax=Penicillium angulare TaxID=116970 RepID=A0A9W9G767_9EURO|nr:hypothetical protein N7456_001958 [Penicillium angulare]
MMTITYLPIFLFASLYAAASIHDTTQRYKQPLLANVQVVDTKDQLGEIQDARPSFLLTPENGGYYLKHPESGEVIAASSDILSIQLDESCISLYQNLKEEGNGDEASNVLQGLQKNGIDLSKPEESANKKKPKCKLRHCKFPPGSQNKGCMRDGYCRQCSVYDRCV